MATKLLVKFQRRITPKIYRQELWFLSFACRLMVFYISMKFHENTQTGFRFKEWICNYYCQISKGNHSKIYKQELWFLRSACRLMMLYISMKFHENIFKYFQDIEQT